MSASQTEAVTGEFSGSEAKEVIAKQRAQVKHKSTTALQTSVRSNWTDKT